MIMFPLSAGGADLVRFQIEGFRRKPNKSEKGDFENE